MHQIYHSLRQVLSGASMIENRIKYRVICLGIAAVHVLFTSLFFALRIPVLYWYNLAVVVFYLYHSFVSVSKERYLFTYVTSMVEILFHASMAAILLGWDWGFTMYTMSLVPVAFYLTYTIPDLREKLYIPVISSATVCVVFVLVRVICGRMEPVFAAYAQGTVQISMYYFNIILAFVLLVLFSTLFALEIRHMQRQLERENCRLGEEASLDPLTHLLNRRSMNMRMRAMCEEASADTAFCLLLLDIDDFKHVNDTYGHDCGDEILVMVADIIMADIRMEDCVCRWGGEEILVMLHAQPDTARNVAQRIADDIATAVLPYKGQDVSITVTIGIAQYTKDKTIRAMIEEADVNLYYGKTHGKNRVVSAAEKADA